MAHISLSIHDLQGNKRCDLYDSYISAPGQAYNVIRTTELNGWKEQSFVLPYMIDTKTNFRWKYVRNECRVRVRVDEEEDWYIISSPKKAHNSGRISNTVTCYHTSSVLKTKNLYAAFDDTNGIDTCQNLISKVLAGTGWTLGECDRFLENDGETEKIRSLSSDGKVGAYQLITNVCGLFNAYPTFHGTTKTVDIHALANKGDLIELVVGKDLIALDATYNSDNIVTRLYVEGEYGDNGYVGIDDVNPTGQTYLMNFDYYKDIGLFTENHQIFQDAYFESIKNTIDNIKSSVESEIALSNEQNQQWGQPKFAAYDRLSAGLSQIYATPTLSEEEKQIKSGDEILTFRGTGTKLYDYVKFTSISALPASSVVIKFLTPSSGSIGAKEAAIEAKDKLIKAWVDDLSNTAEDQRIDFIQDQVTALNSEIADIRNGTDNATGLFTEMNSAISKIRSLKTLETTLESLREGQANQENQLVSVLGDMLRDGYWSNTNYIPGQEKMLYNDAIEMMAELAKPQVSYTISLAHATDIWGVPISEYELNSRAHVYDPELEINDVVFIDKLVEYLDDPSKSTIQISNNDLSITGKSFDSILGRISQQADLIDQKSSLYERSDIINSDGSIFIDRLNGTIDVLKNRLLSTTSSWYTDDSGNIVFQSVSGTSAMMLTGEGFMIASGKDDNGEWIWRTFGTGEGFTADAIITGYLSAERIEAHSIGSGQLSSTITEKINKIDTFSDKINENSNGLNSANESLQALIKKVSEAELTLSPEFIISTVTSSSEVMEYITSFGTVHVGTTPPSEQSDDQLWLDTSISPPLLKRCEYNEQDKTYSWVIVNDTAALEEFSNALQYRMQQAEEKITDSSIVNTVTSSEVYQNQLERMRQSAVTQTVDEFEIRFTEQEGKIGQVASTANDLKNSVSTWFRFNEDGLVIGKDGSPFMTKQDNREYGFYYNNQKVAYMEGSVQNIPQTYARDILRIGGLQGAVDSSGSISWTWIGLDK